MAIEVVELKGGPYERGRAHGVARRRQIHAWSSAWLDSLRQAGVGDPELYLASMLKDTAFLDAVRHHAADLLDEVQGMAVGAEEPVERLIAAQFMDEEWAYRRQSVVAADTAHKCSSLALAEGRMTWIGQNMDLGGWTDGHQVLLRVASDGLHPDALVFSVGGLIGLMGVNASGMGLCVNSLPQLPSARKGLPVAFMVRKVLQARSLAEATHILRELPHASGQHYLLADAAGICSFEASANGVLEYHASDPARVFHTNHPLIEQEQQTSSPADHTNTVARLRSMVERLSGREPNLSAVMAALSSADDPANPVCRPLGDLRSATGFTAGSMISCIQAGADGTRCWVSAGPPDARGYSEFHLARTWLS